MKHSKIEALLFALTIAAASTAAIQQLVFQPVPDTTPNPTETTTFTIAVIFPPSPKRRSGFLRHPGYP